MTDQTRVYAKAVRVEAPQSARAMAEAERQKIAESLRAAISGGTFGTSGRLPTERALAERFQTTRSAVRKVTDDLVEEGLIERHVGRGTFVAEEVAAQPGSAPDFTLSELLEARLMFEPHLPDLVVERATDEDIAIMEAYLAEMRKAVSWAEFKEAKYCLHLMIVRSAKNRFLASMFEQIIASRRRAHWGRPGAHPAPAAAVREAAWEANAVIVRALRDKDAATAGTQIRKYLLDTLLATSQS